MTTRIRNLGIAAHVDAGKTTLTERILLYTGRIHRAGDVRGEHETVTDHDKQEQRSGITIRSAAVTCAWAGAAPNLVDAPGHIDFTVEVERAMRALDGAVLVLDAVAGVQAQTRTVERQMARYGVARVAFVNKCDREGADPLGVVRQLRERLGVDAVAVQLPVGLGADLRGVVDVVRLQLVTFGGESGRDVRREPVPAALAEQAEAARAALVDVVSMHDDALTAAVLAGGEIDVVTLQAAIRRATLARAVVPVLMGSAYRFVGVQPLLDAVVDWLPGPEDRPQVATDAATGDEVAVETDPDGPVVALAFKVDETEHGAVTWLRVLRGRLEPGQRLVDGRDGSRHRVRRLVEIFAGQLRPTEDVHAGDVVAAFGLTVASGTTLCAPEHRVVLGAMHVPEPMVEARVTLVSGSPDRLSKALGQLVREDPTLRVHTDPETGELRLTGMGELHLDVVRQWLCDDHDVVVGLGAPSARGRLALGRTVDFDTTLSKQTGGPGMWARLVGRIEPAEDFSFAWEVTAGAVPSTFRKAIEAGFRLGLEHEADLPVVGARVVVTDGATHPNDSSDQAFHLCARLAFREVLERAAPVELVPMARVETEAPPEHHGAVLSSLASRGGRITSAEVGEHVGRVEAEVPLAAMFGYSATLRSVTSGTGAFTAEFSHYEAR